MKLPPLVEESSPAELTPLGWWTFAVLIVLAILPYARALGLPLIADDYVQIQLAREYGPVSGWTQLAADPLYRCRATSLVLTYWTERWFGLSALAFNWSSLILHIVNTLLVLALGRWKVIGWRVSIVAAGFFAVYQGHQEAVIWYAALPELLVFFFVFLCLLSWIRWAETGSALWLAATGVLFVLALLSKESAVVIVPLMGLVLLLQHPRHWRRFLAVIPFGLLSLLYFWGIFANRSHHLHFNDAGTFSIWAPVWITIPVSVARLFWIWGCLSLAALFWLRERRRIVLISTSLAWIVITLLPYSFLTYMHRVPSRHVYLASVGLSLVVAAGFLGMMKRFENRAALPWALASIIVLHHCAYLWTRKHAQFLDRAAPTELVIDYASRASGPVHLHCFPYDPVVAQLAVRYRLGKEVILPGSNSNIPSNADVYCPAGHRLQARAN